MTPAPTENQHAEPVGSGEKRWHLGHVPGTVIVDKAELEALRTQLAGSHQAREIDQLHIQELLGRVERVQGELAEAQALLGESVAAVDEVKIQRDQAIQRVRQVEQELEHRTRAADHYYAELLKAEQRAQRAKAVVEAARWIEEDGWTSKTRAALYEALRNQPRQPDAATPSGSQGEG